MTAPVIPTTLKKRADFVRLNRARKFVGDYFILRYGPATRPEAMEFGYTVTTKCGNAVLRNRTKRRLRALVRELATTLAKPGMAYNFIARADVSPSAAEVEYALLRAAMEKALTRAGAPA